ncbi:hypothetical protein ACMFMG_006863 [Clarireedia jacksonii]
MARITIHNESQQPRTHTPSAADSFRNAILTHSRLSYDAPPTPGTSYYQTQSTTTSLPRYDTPSASNPLHNTDLEPPPPYTERSQLLPRKPPSYTSSLYPDLHPDSSEVESGYHYQCQHPGARRGPLVSIRTCHRMIIGILIFIVFITFVGLLSAQVWDVGIKEPVRRQRVAVVGAGPAGVGCAVELMGQGQGVEVEIVVFEEKRRVGGRMVLGDDDGEVEVEDVMNGGLMESLVEVIRDSGSEDWKGIEVFKKAEEVGIYNDKTLLASTTRPYTSLPYSTWLSLLFHYGPSIWRAHALPTGTVSSLTKLLSTRPPSPFPSIRALLLHLRSASPSTSALTRLQKNGISTSYTHDILAPQIRRHTGGQEVSEISDLAMSIALSREEQGVQREAQGVYSAIMNSLLSPSSSGVDLRTGTKVTGLRREMVNDDGVEKWVLEYVDLGNASATVGYEAFDKIVIAAPFNGSLVKDSIALDDADANALQANTDEYRVQYITFFSTRSPLPHSRFGSRSSDTLPTQLLPQTPSPEGITEISLLRTITHPTLSHQYRVLSSVSISNATFQRYMGMEPDTLETWTQYSIPYAYPLMYARSSVEVEEDFAIREGLWTTSGAEGVLGSSVDLSWVVGRNVGRLVSAELRRDRMKGK